MKVHIENHKKNQNKEIVEFRTPKFVTIPIIRGKDTNLTEFVKKGDYVRKYERLAHTKKDNFPIYSPVSGTVVGFEERNIKEEKVRCIIIENDYKERCMELQPTEIKDKQAYIEIIKNAGIIGLGGAGFPAYLKYSADSIKTLIVNAVECEPYITADATVIQKHCEEILTTLDQIMKINKIKECVIVLKKENKEALSTLKRRMGTYPTIQIQTVDNYYPAGWERSIIKDVKNIEYKNIPIEQGIVVSNISTIFAIYEALKYQKPLIERIVTFAGSGLKHPTNVLVKIGTSAKEVIESTIGYKRNKDLLIIAGGPMMGTSEPNDDIIITADINCILVLPYQEEIETTCIRCGKCNAVCPVRISPVLIKDNCENKERLKQLEPNRCIGCGLCSYICPAKIPVRNFVAKAKKRMQEEK